MNRYLLLDCNYLAHRARYAYKDLSHKGSATGTTYGFLRELLFLMERFDTTNLIFCWDSKESKRREIYPEYKADRKKEKKEISKTEAEFEKDFHKQVRLLRRKYLPEIGFRNVFCQKGYEADDLIAIICQNLGKRDQAIIISADTDLYQLISSKVIQYNPHKKLVMTSKEFRRIFSMKPKDFVKVKCIAGCPTDNVRGIYRVGTLTAISYLIGKINKKTKTYENIKNGLKDVVKRNRPLVELPFKGIKMPEIVRDDISQQGWNAVTKRLGMKSIRWKKRKRKKS
jgi:DNA polymerase-1